MINGVGHPRGHVYTVEQIRESQWEGEGLVFDCLETTKSGRECESRYSLADNILENYNKRGYLAILGPKPE
jgi:hypothetical protein